MRHKLLVLTVKKFLQSVYIYGSYRKIKTGVPFFLDHPVYIFQPAAAQVMDDQHQMPKWIVTMPVTAPW